jgi:phosphoglycolate phosphatase
MPLTPPADAVVFDFDGVIIDSLPAVTAAINGALADHGYPAHSSGELARFIGPPTLTAFVELIGQPPDSDAVAALVASYHEHYERVFLEKTRLVDGMTDVLRALALPLALATAKEHKFVSPLLEHLGLRFDVISAPELAEPKRETLARALRELAARRAVMIGDTRYDIEAARACGVRVVAVTWGIGREHEMRDADALVRRPAELAQLLA